MPILGGGEISAETLMATDLPRLWATGVQVFPQPNFTMVVFREQISAVNSDDPDASADHIIKNVSSVIVPNDVMESLRDILVDLFPKDKAAKDV